MTATHADIRFCSGTEEEEGSEIKPQLCKHFVLKAPAFAQLRDRIPATCDSCWSRRRPALKRWPSLALPRCSTAQHSTALICRPGYSCTLSLPPGNRKGAASCKVRGRSIVGWQNSIVRGRGGEVKKFRLLLRSPLMLSERRKEKRPQTYDSALSVFAQQLEGQRAWLIPTGTQYRSGIVGLVEIQEHRK